MRTVSLSPLIVAGCLAASAVGLSASRVAAQTWAGNQSTPELGQLVAVDATGEQDWLFGQEDLAGDGDTFMAQEQSIDIRTLYATAHSSGFWARVYVSNQNSPGGNVTVYVFIDADRDTSTGGSAAAQELDPAFTTDNTQGGYDYVLGIQGNEMIAGIWEWDDAQMEFTEIQGNPTAASAEVGTDLDPIRVGASDHGYLQGTVDLDVVGLTEACDAELFVRSTNSSPMLGEGDLNVGMRLPCIPSDPNNNGIPDVAEPQAECTNDNECPSGGVCVNGRCALPDLCNTDADCPSGQECNANSQCVAVGGDMCSTTADCGDLVCSGGECVACTSDGMCASGERCGPDGRCISSVNTGSSNPAEEDYVLGADEVIQGGACTCRLPHRPSRNAWALSLAAVALVLLRRKRH